VHDDPVLSRKGDNLHCEVMATIVEAALGAHVPVPGPEAELSLSLPPGTQGGQVFRLRGPADVEYLVCVVHP
jgi:molecular chaperone DnaJ